MFNKKKDFFRNIVKTDETPRPYLHSVNIERRQIKTLIYRSAFEIFDIQPIVNYVVDEKLLFHSDQKSKFIRRHYLFV